MSFPSQRPSLHIFVVFFISLRFALSGFNASDTRACASTAPHSLAAANKGKYVALAVIMQTYQGRRSVVKKKFTSQHSVTHTRVYCTCSGEQSILLFCLCLFFLCLPVPNQSRASPFQPLCLTCLFQCLDSCTTFFLRFFFTCSVFGSVLAPCR